MKIGGVKIKPLDAKHFYSLVEANLKLEDVVFDHAVTVNPEFIIAAQSNEEFRRILNQATYTLVDGVGLLGAMKYQLRTENAGLSSLAQLIQFVVSCVDAGVLRQPVVVDGVWVERMTGVDMIHELMMKDWMKGKRVFLLGGKMGVAERAANELGKLSAEVIFGWDEGHKDFRSQISDLRSLGQDQESLALIEKINEFKADVLLVAYGHPWQDIWIDRVKHQLSSVRLAMGVGGSFDYLAGEVVRAPEWMRNIGLEWLYRVVNQPKRIGRIMDATWRFAKLVVQKSV